MKLIITIITLFYFILYSQVYINEIDYDQPSTDDAEFIELVGPDGASLDGYVIELVTGSNGSVYRSVDLNGEVIPSDNVNGFGFFVIGAATVSNVDLTPSSWPTTDIIQNGSPDGLLLKLNGAVVDGFSYEGAIDPLDNSDFTAGMAISATEDNADDPNLSIGRTTLGFDDTDQDQFFESTSNTPSPGAVNSAHGQTDQSLPVSLTSFTATAGNSKVTLHWITASEQENVGFEVLRSTEKQGDYSLLSSYENNPNLEGQFNSSTQTKYIFEDQTVVNDVTYWYKLVDVDVNGVHVEHGPMSATPHAVGSDITTINVTPAGTFSLHPNYPNPFNPSTTLRFDIPALSSGESAVEMIVYNTQGQEVKTLFEGILTPGTHQLTWNGDSDSGALVSSGTYFAILKMENLVRTSKMLLIK